METLGVCLCIGKAFICVQNSEETVNRVRIKSRRRQESHFHFSIHIFCIACFFLFFFTLYYFGNSEVHSKFENIFPSACGLLFKLAFNLQKSFMWYLYFSS